MAWFSYIFAFNFLKRFSIALCNEAFNSILRWELRWIFLSLKRGRGNEQDMLLREGKNAANGVRFHLMAPLLLKVNTLLLKLFLHCLCLFVEEKWGVTMKLPPHFDHADPHCWLPNFLRVWVANVKLLFS